MIFARNILLVFPKTPIGLPLAHGLVANNKSFEEIEFSVNFKRLNTDYDNVLLSKVSDWDQDGQKRDPRQISNKERREKRKERRENEKKASSVRFILIFCSILISL